MALSCHNITCIGKHLFVVVVVAAGDERKDALIAARLGTEAGLGGFDNLVL